MKLYYSKRSPYVRKVRLVAIEKGIANQIDLVETNPHNSPPGLLAVNPLGKIPVLELDNGETLYDSPVICEFLDSIDDAKPMIPADGTGRFKVLTLAALADGVMDAAVAIVLENNRPADKRSIDFIDRQLACIRRGVEALEEEVSFLASGINLASLAVAAMLGYLNFRVPDLGWEPTHPKLAGWFDKISTRASMQETVPVPA